jgi:N-acetylmuramoyl-L-alanine amidase
LVAAALSLRGKVIALDAGHGGIDPGALGPDGLQEDAVVLAVTQQLEGMLEHSGALVIMTRGADESTTGATTSGPNGRTRINLERRVQLVNAAAADVVVSIHANSYPDASSHGAQTFYQGRFPESRVLADLVQKQLKRLTGETRRSISEHINHYILNHTDMPGVTVEIGFLTNPREAQLLATPAYRQRVAYAVFVGLAEWFSRLPPPAQRGGTGVIAPSSPRPHTASSPS